ncbi:MAG: hypothetical protein HC859_17525, partial [Bacteroidia bacterium]|nr:hypothetical protein [Bacteroidia bacterium]
MNNGNVSGTITYHIIPTFNGCTGQAVDLVVQVRPLPTATASDITICSGEAAVIPISTAPKNVAGTTFAWVAVPSGNVSGALDGNGSTINQVLTTTDANVGTVMYQIYPTANTCLGPVTVVTVTVNPAATVSAGADYSVCEPASIVLSGTVGGSASSATWTFVGGNGSISGSTTTFPNVTATYTLGVGDVGSAIQFVLTTNDPDGVGPCTPQADAVLVTVNPEAGVTAPADYFVCEPGSITLSATLTGSATSGTWSKVSGVGNLTVSSVTGSQVTAVFIPDPADVGTTVSFLITTNDPDGSGPCTVATDDLSITINESA